MGAGLGWMPAFVNKFPLKSHLVSLIEGDEELAKPGPPPPNLPPAASPPSARTTPIAFARIPSSRIALSAHLLCLCEKGGHVDARVHHVHAHAAAVCVAARGAGLEKRVADLSRHDLLDLCLERNVGHPQWERAQLQQALQDYRKQADDFQASLRALRPSPGPTSAHARSYPQTASLPLVWRVTRKPCLLASLPQRQQQPDQRAAATAGRCSVETAWLWRHTLCCVATLSLVRRYTLSCVVAACVCWPLTGDGLVMVLAGREGRGGGDAASNAAPNGTDHDVDPFRMRLVLLALHSASSARQVCLPARALACPCAARTAACMCSSKQSATRSRAMPLACAAARDVTDTTPREHTCNSCKQAS